MCSAHDIYLDLSPFKECVEHQLESDCAEHIQKSFTHVFFPAPPQVVAALAPVAAPRGVWGRGAWAPGESAGGPAAVLHPVGCTQRRRLVPAWRCHYRWALQSTLQASTGNSQLHPPTKPQVLHWVTLKCQFFFFFDKQNALYIVVVVRALKQCYNSSTMFDALSASSHPCFQIANSSTAVFVCHGICTGGDQSQPDPAARLEAGLLHSRQLRLAHVGHAGCDDAGRG